MLLRVDRGKPHSLGEGALQSKQFTPPAWDGYCPVSNTAKSLPFAPFNTSNGMFELPFFIGNKIGNCGLKVVLALFQIQHSHVIFGNFACDHEATNFALPKLFLFALDRSR